ncbi:hypothetical protein CC86DRAFT_285382 [Ophiobolus disseminans]|uniref:Uncharacterized protein n=1 Tax=Ophiobolus disseminans TaxID=1469910 RepID=A0A6A7AAP7_9PLEO|nr:hypothetical protein CC86DRAFT_285382 [Ophiobolus disseminans]
MLFSMNIWAVYGIGLEPRATDCVTCVFLPSSSEPIPSMSFQTPLSATARLPSPHPTLDLAIETSSPVAPPDSQNISSASSISATTILTISISLTLSIIVILFLAFGIPYLRKWRRSCALQRAVDEVERGIEMRKDIGHGSTSEVTESKENMVLESRVEIVVGDEESERDVVDAWDGWNATWDGDDDEDLEERGRKGMSLPRREY